MTLIAVFLGKNGDFAALSDAWIGSTDSPKQSADHLPLQAGCPRGVVTKSSKLMLKTILRGNHLFLWAGSVISARHIARRILDQPKQDGPQEVIDKIDKIDASILSEVSFIYCHHTSESLVVHAHNCYVEERDTHILITEGTGSGDVVYDQFSFESPNSIPGCAFDEVFRRFGEAVHRELYEREHFEKTYGGLYEITLLGPSGGFRKIPYSLDVFFSHGEFLEHEARCTLTYRGNMVLATMLGQSLLDSPVPSYNGYGLIVGDLFSSKMAPVKISVRELFQEHDHLMIGYAVDFETKRFSLRTITGKHLVFLFENGQAKVNVSEACAT